MPREVKSRLACSSTWRSAFVWFKVFAASRASKADRLQPRTACGRYLSHFRSVHRGAYFAQLRTTAVRKLLPESWGFMCPVHTPDGSPCGLLTHLTAACRVVTYPPAPPVPGGGVAQVHAGIEKVGCDRTNKTCICCNMRLLPGVKTNDHSQIRCAHLALI